MEHIYKEHFLRNTESLNGTWSFCPDVNNVGIQEKWFCNFPKDSRIVNVPSCWNFELDLFGYFGVAWYSKEIVTRKEFISLEFGAVSGLCTVYLDGKQLCEHYGGWTEFSASDYVEEGKHLIVVRVDASSNDTNTIPLQNVDWYHYGGITRSVFINRYKSAFIKFHRISYSLGESLKNVELSFNLKFFDPYKQFKKIPLKIMLDGNEIYKKEIDITNDSSFEISSIYVENIILWDIENPKMYEVIIQTPDDDIIEHIGFRKIEIKDSEFLLNGKKMFFRGVNRHEEHPDWGFAVPANIQKRDLDIIKDMNCNIVRGSHYPNSQTFLDYLDENGILFWSEIPLWGYTPKALADPLTLERSIKMHSEMIDQYYHHPSIIIWGLHNEIYTDSKEGFDFTKNLYEFVKSKDDTRLITFATCRFEKDICLEYCDFVSLNYYMGWYKGTFSDWEEFISTIEEKCKVRSAAGKPVVMSEFGSAALYGNSNFSNDKWTMQYQSDMLSKVINECIKDNIVRGTFVWQFADIKSDVDINRARSFNNKGLLDEYRRPKMSYYTVKNLYKHIKNLED